MWQDITPQQLGYTIFLKVCIFSNPPTHLPAPTHVVCFSRCICRDSCSMWCVARSRCHRPARLHPKSAGVLGHAAGSFTGRGSSISGVVCVDCVFLFVIDTTNWRRELFRISGLGYGPPTYVASSNYIYAESSGRDFFFEAAPPRPSKGKCKTGRELASFPATNTPGGAKHSQIHIVYIERLRARILEKGKKVRRVGYWV